jgi:hypothetical protein
LSGSGTTNTIQTGDPPPATRPHAEYGRDQRKARAIRHFIEVTPE